MSTNGKKVGTLLTKKLPEAPGKEIQLEGEVEMQLREARFSGSTRDRSFTNHLKTSAPCAVCEQDQTSEVRRIFHQEGRRTDSHSRSLSFECRDKTPFDYSVFSAAGAAFLLAVCEPDRFTFDNLLGRSRSQAGTRPHTKLSSGRGIPRLIQRVPWSEGMAKMKAMELGDAVVGLQ